MKQKKKSPSIQYLEEKEKRKHEFDKQIQMIIKSDEEKAKEMERRKRTKLTKQGLVDNDAYYSSIYNMVNKKFIELFFVFI